MQRQSMHDLIASIISDAIKIQENKSISTHTTTNHEEVEFEDVEHHLKWKSYMDGEHYLDRIDRQTSRKLNSLSSEKGQIRKTVRREVFDCLKMGHWDDVEKFLEEYYNRFHGVLRMGRSQFFHMTLCRANRSLKYSFPKLDALSMVCRHGHSGCIPHILDLNSFRQGRAEVQDALLEAVRGGHLDCYHRLMESRLLQDHRFESPYSEILTFAKASDFDRVEELVKGSDLEELGQAGLDLVNLLMMNGCPASCLSVLLQRGIDANMSDSNGMNPISSAVLSNNIGCFRYLLDLNSDSLCQKSALMFAASLQDTLCLELLLRRGAHVLVNSTDPSGWPALTSACLYGNTKSVLMLLEAGANMEILDSRDNSILVPVMKSGNTQCLKLVLNKLNAVYCSQEMIEKTKDVKCLVENVGCLRIFVEHCNFSLDKVFKNGKTLLTVASSKGFIQSVQWLLEKGADVELMCGAGLTALMHACCKDQYEVVKLLIEKGANVNATTFMGNTALTCCIRARTLTCFNLMLAAGADTNSMVNYSHMTILTFAMVQNEVKVLDMLLENGQILQHGDLKQVHKNSIKQCTLERNEITATALTCLMKHGLFEWSWLSGYTFRKIMFSAVYSGMCPGAVRYYTLKMYPLVLSFVLNEIAVVKYCLANLYFFPEDYSILCSNQLVRFLINLREQELRSLSCVRRRRRRFSGQSRYAHDNAQIRKLLAQVTHQTLSLQTWSFLTVSKAISLSGLPSQRSKRVDALPIPDFLKQRLKFQTDLSKVCRVFWEAVDIGTPGDMVFSKTRRRISNLFSEKNFPYHCINCGGLGASFEDLGIDMRKENAEGGDPNAWSVDSSESENSDDSNYSDDDEPSDHVDSDYSDEEYYNSDS